VSLRTGGRTRPSIRKSVTHEIGALTPVRCTVLPTASLTDPLAAEGVWLLRRSLSRVEATTTWLLRCDSHFPLDPNGRVPGRAFEFHDGRTPSPARESLSLRTGGRARPSIGKSVTHEIGALTPVRCTVLPTASLTDPLAAERVWLLGRSLSRVETTTTRLLRRSLSRVESSTGDFH
jgi:hypothetical protein